MQKAIVLEHRGMTMRGMLHFPDGQSDQPVPAVILFHGFTGNKLEPHRLFLKISRALAAAGLACFRFDFLGSGESDGDFEDMTLSGEVSDANAILDMVKSYPGIDTDRVNLLGLSMGGLVASLVAGTRPSDVHRLVLMAPAATMYRIAAELDRKRAAGEIDAPEIEGKDVAYDNAGNLVGLSFVNELRHLDAYSVAKGYDGPVLLVHGTRDEAVPYQVSHEYKEKCYGDKATLHIIEGADHTFNSYAWETDVIYSVLEFLAQPE
ncbi:alpha/beta hydrolase [Alicyclobacillus mengziensis]|uniref:Alpha/beta fold hydrolase n=1 Tax=Alicyclobacillus mengziensis TaxID=2931921 RepID=A0A9X7Z6M2_9BACL|nr:alpha/beta fold hydrolase [Alicyclobacillus mengziensis]QSO48124.1 alpha/beta fold hydrolase [Alicyclobacillus mengziensis]